jgi:hypothetical protein
MEIIVLIIIVAIMAFAGRNGIPVRIVRDGTVRKPPTSRPTTKQISYHPISAQDAKILARLRKSLLATAAGDFAHRRSFSNSR